MQIEEKNKIKVEREITDPDLKEHSGEGEVKVINLKSDTNLPQRSAGLERILEEIFLSDHDAAQLEQYLSKTALIKGLSIKS